MRHGIEGYYLERARFERRLSLFIALVSLATIGTESLFQAPELQRWLAPVLRFGYEGPEEFVRRLVLEPPGRADKGLRMTPPLDPRASRRGGAHERPRSRSLLAIPEVRMLREGPGDSERDLLAQARALHPRQPVFRSEDLVIDNLVKPDYPEDARENGIEGKVALMAKLDTTGRVVDIQLLESNGGRLLERAATQAVWQCRFRPFRHGGETREVYAVFHFAFTLY